MTGDELRAARRTLNLSLRDMGRALGCSDRSVERYEAGHWSIDTARQILVEIYLAFPDALKLVLIYRKD